MTAEGTEGGYGISHRETIPEIPRQRHRPVPVSPRVAVWRRRRHRPPCREGRENQGTGTATLSSWTRLSRRARRGRSTGSHQAAILQTWLVKHPQFFRRASHYDTVESRTTAEPPEWGHSSTRGTTLNPAAIRGMPQHSAEATSGHRRSCRRSAVSEDHPGLWFGGAEKGEPLLFGGGCQPRIESHEAET
jgi:hypothetical protein